MKKVNLYIAFLSLTLSLPISLLADSTDQALLRELVDANEAEAIHEILFETNSHEIKLGSLLRRASRRGYTDTMKELIAAGADIHERGPSGDSAAYWAVIKGHIDAVTLLLDHGADPGERCTLGHSLLYWAGDKGFSEIEDLLIEAGVIDAEDELTTSVNGLNDSKEMAETPGDLFGTPVFKVYP